MKKLKLSIVIPVYNEVEVLPLLFERIISVLESCKPSLNDYEIIFVNDGSSDQSLDFLSKLLKNNPHIIIINLSRNFGHQAAISAGLSEARGEAAIVMDADLQDPPELIPEMLKAWHEGFQLVIARRRSRQERGLKLCLFNLFYSLFGFLSDYPITLNAGVYGLMDRVVIDQLNRLTERNRFLPGLRSWIGFRETVVWYDREERAAGKPKQSLLNLLKYGFDAIFSFSYKPLRLSLLLGLTISISSFTYAAVLLIMRLLQINVVPGFTTPTISILFLGGVQLIGIGILGEYLGRIYDEVKQRPIFIVDNILRSTGNKKTNLFPENESANEPTGK